MQSNGSADRDLLVSLIDESFDEITSLEEVIKIETPRILDLSNENPDASNAAITSANLKIARLNKALPLLRARIDTIDRETALAECNAEVHRVRADSDEIYEELKELYVPFLQKIMHLYLRARDNAAEFYELKRRAPKGADLRFFGAMPYESFWLNLILPSWNNPNVVYPERQTPEQIAWAQQVAITTAMVNAAKANDLKFAPNGGRDWHEGQKIDQERLDAANAKFEAEQKERDQKSRDAYSQALLENERRHVRGEI